MIDPGVGTTRRPIIIKTKNYIFIGPDNGVLYPAAANDGIEKVIEINNNKLYLSKNISNTFHGRDIFAVAAALISIGVEIDIFGRQISHEEIIKIKFDYNISERRICGKIIYIDHFGNVATSIPANIIINNKIKYNQIITFTINNKIKYNARVVKTFGYGNENELILYSNGYFFVEIGINKGSAKDKLNVKEGDEICLEDYTQVDFSHSI